MPEGRPVAQHRATLERGDRRDTAPQGREPPVRNPASNASPAPVVSTGWIGVVATSNRSRSCAVADEDRGAMPAALDDDDRGELEDLLLAGAEEGAGLVGGGEDEVRRRAVEELEGRLATVGEERRGGGEVDARPGRRLTGRD